MDLDRSWLKTALVIVGVLCSCPLPIRAGSDAEASIYLCSDDRAESREAFIEGAAARLSIARFLSVSDCKDPAMVTRRQKTVLGRFIETEDQGVELVLELNTDPVERKARHIPWLSSSRAPLEETLDRHKVAALCIILDNLVLEFEGIDFSDAPSLPEPPPAPELPRPPAEEVVTEEVKVEPVVDLLHIIHAGGGVKVLPASALAPILGLGYVLVYDRIELLLDLGYELDSTYELEDRPFTTWALTGRLGVGYLLVRKEHDLVGIELGGQWRLSSYRRDGVEEAQFHRWNDFGLGGYLAGRLRISDPLGALIRVGMQYFPTARVAEIQEGPTERVESYNIIVTGGIDFIL